MGPFLLLYEDCGEEVRHVDAAQPERGEIDADHPIGLGQSHVDGTVFAKGTAGGDQHTVAVGRWDKRRCVSIAKRAKPRTAAAPTGPRDIRKEPIYRRPDASARRQFGAAGTRRLAGCSRRLVACREFTASRAAAETPTKSKHDPIKSECPRECWVPFLFLMLR